MYFCVARGAPFRIFKRRVEELGTFEHLQLDRSNNLCCVPRVMRALFRTRLDLSKKTSRHRKKKKKNQGRTRLEISDEHRFFLLSFFHFFSLRRREQNGQGFGHLQLYRSVEVGRQPSTSKPPLCRWHSRGRRGKLNSIPFPCRIDSHRLRLFHLVLLQKFNVSPIGLWLVHQSRDKDKCARAPI